jgi:hypothetical protein
MRLTRPAVAIAVGASLVVAGQAGAVAKKPKPVPPVCNLIIDDKGDGAGLIDANDPSLDIVGGDIASNATKVTAVIRLDGAPVAAGNKNSPEGAAYYFLFSVPGAQYPLWLAASSDITGAYTYTLGDVEPSPTGGNLYQTKTGVVTGALAGKSITLSVDRSVLAALGDVKPGVKVTGLDAQSFTPLEVPHVGGSLPQADDAASTKSYTAGAASCLKV